MCECELIIENEPKKIKIVSGTKNVIRICGETVLEKFKLKELTVDHVSLCAIKNSFNMKKGYILIFGEKED